MLAVLAMSVACPAPAPGADAGADAVVFVNSAVESEAPGGYELGPPVRARIGAAVVDGWSSDPAVVAGVLDAIDRMPVEVRGRIAWNRFAPTLVDVGPVTPGAAAAGAAAKVFLSVDFADDRPFVRERERPADGEREVLHFVGGALLRAVTADRITETEFGADGQELSSRTSVNEGSLDEPVLGERVEETRTLATWMRGELAGPYEPRIAKLRVNFTTGESRREVYGLFPQPFETADAWSVTRIRFDAEGELESAEVYTNAADPAAADPERLLNPVVGPLRSRLGRLAPGDRPEDLQDPTLTVFQHDDVLLGTSAVRAVDPDPLRGGRTLLERSTEAFDESRSVTVESRFEYRDDFARGLVPARTVKVALPSGKVLETAEATGVDPESGTLTMRVTDHAGRVNEQTWTQGQTAPRTVRSALRMTESIYSVAGDSFTSTTVTNDTGEEVERSEGTFDASTGRWSVTRTTWWSPGVAAGVETRSLTPGGRLLLAVAEAEGGRLETRPEYGDDGEEIQREVWWVPDEGESANLLVRRESGFQYDADGRQTAEVETFVGGDRTHTGFSATRDAEGRLVLDRVRDFAELGLSLRTVNTYEGGSNRLARSEEFQGEHLRTTREPVGHEDDPNQGPVLRIRETPAWGEAQTVTFRLGDPLGRPLKSVSDGGRTSVVTRWFSGTAVPEVTETRDRIGRVISRSSLKPASDIHRGAIGDVIHRRPVGFSGVEGQSPWKMVVVTGTGIALVEKSVDGWLIYDFSEPGNQPSHTVSITDSGASVAIGGEEVEDVVAVQRQELLGADGGGDGRLRIDEIELANGLSGTATRTVFAPDGARLDVTTAPIRLGNLNRPEGAAVAKAELFDRFEDVLSESGTRVVYRYEPGWLVRGDARVAGTEAVVVSPVAVAGPGQLGVVNEAGAREVVTGIDTFRTGGEGGEVLIKRARHPQELMVNPRMPDAEDLWTSWAVEDLDADGRVALRSEWTVTASGEGETLTQFKSTGAGADALRVSYRLPPWEQNFYDLFRDQSPDFPTHERDDPIDLQGITDFSDCDFLWVYYMETGNWVRGVDTTRRVRIVDEHGTEALFSERPAAPSETAFWPDAGSAAAEWLPDPGAPGYGASVSRGGPAGNWSHSAIPLVISIPQLAARGLDTARLRSANFIGWPPSVYTPAMRLVRPAAAVPAGTVPPLAEPSSLRHASGIDAVTVNRDDGSLLSQLTPPAYWNADLFLGGSEVARVRPRQDASLYPAIYVQDESDPRGSRPLYCLGADDGAFIELYRVSRGGEAGTGVGSAAAGLDPPKLNVFRPGVLDDELSPGLLAYGPGLEIGAELAKEGPEIRNRAAFSIFKLFGDRLGVSRPVADGAGVDLGATPGGTGGAGQFADEVRELPTLAGAVLARSQPRWSWFSPEDLGGEREPEFALPPGLAVELHTRRIGFPNTYLIPPDPGTDVGPFVDTEREAAVIELAVALGNDGLAGELIAFYHARTGGGTVPVHASYDARTGASTVKLPRYEREADSPSTAGATVALARAALAHGRRTGDPGVLRFAAELVRTLRREFRLSESASAEPAFPGLAELRFQPRSERLGKTLWPDPAKVGSATNAGAFLLFTEALELAEAGVFDGVVPDRFGDLLADAVREQRSWLEDEVLPVVRETGVVPSGFFEVQDVATGSTAFATGRWTTSEGWLAVIEAAHVAGVPASETQAWLDNLAAVHGVGVDGAWGLDWSLALTRPDAISPELTARLLRVARLIGHQEAAAVAAASLAEIGDGGWLPSAVTAGVPDRAVSTGEGRWAYPNSDGSGWPRSLEAVYELGLASGLFGAAAPEREATVAEADAVAVSFEPLSRRPDLRRFGFVAGGFYLSVLAVSVMWWLIRAARERRRGRIAAAGGESGLVGPGVMAKAEERWAKRVLGATVAATSPHSRYSNGPVEGDFIIQLKAINKLVMEWRRLELGWEDDDERLVDSDEDDWLNGSDEFVVVVGVVMRWFIKAGRKDGFPKADVMDESEDSNHIWSRLLLYFSEYYWGMLTLLEHYRHAGDRRERAEVNQQITLLLNAMGMRQRKDGFDGRELYGRPGEAGKFDLLVVQKPGVALQEVAEAVQDGLGVPRRIVVGFVKKYKDFKRREQPYPVHPFVMEAAKLLPHFVIMALFGIILYNREVDGLPVLPYLGDLVYQLMAAPSLAWLVPLVLGYGFSVAAHYVDIYRYRASMRPKLDSELLVFSSLTSLFTKDFVILPLTRPGKRWDPVWYARAGWILRGVGFAVLGWQLMALPVATFAAFLVVKGLIALLVLVEAAAMLVPLATSWISRWWTDRGAPGGGGGKIVRVLNQLNITPTRPSSFVWLGLKYHYQFSVPSGGVAAMVQAVVFYFVFAGVFILVGGYTLKEVLGVWFVDVYQNGWDLRLLAGGFVFLNTMYLLRFGLYIAIAAATAALATYPVRVGALLAAAVAALWCGLDAGAAGALAARPGLVWGAAGALALAAAFEGRVLAWLRSSWPFAGRRSRRLEREESAVREYAEDRSKSFGVVYMSGDDLSYRKLKPEILIPRWRVLEEKLASRAAALLADLHGIGSRDELAGRLAELSALEEKHDATLFHPSQLVEPGAAPALPERLGLNIEVAGADERERLLGTWHLRRWLVSMMSTAGNSQDTAINLVDIALRLTREGLGARLVFYLIQNKYDARDDNRPSQLRYDEGELGQREKLAGLLTHLAPGSRAYNLNDWTPFGFKAGGLIAMDMVYEESLKLTNMLVLDRNATVHDLEALVEDVRGVIADPGVINVIPGRSTTNTLTPIGQGSQALEEGHRQLLKGVMLLGGQAGEAVGTGWGNIQAIYYGRVQKAMMDLGTSQRPLTTRQLRGCSFGDRFEGMIGFAPHAVGISEDTWAVTQATHNAIALGIPVKFRRSKAMWHKIRETWSHADWFSAFPRWAGGFLQMMQDPVMQRINDDGPLTVFAKEVRANNGRFFLSVPFAILNIMLMPLAIIWGVSPFVQILIVLWNLGFLMNQVLTTLGLVACLEATGFSKVSGLVGAGLAGVACGLTGGALPWLPLALVAGLVAGGFATGLARWLLDRGRDIIMFGPQLVIHAVGQFVRQSLEFVVSGAAATDADGVNMAFRTWVGPKEQQPWARYANLVNPRTLVWGFGLVSVLLNAIALRELDFLNVVLLLPSLLFSVSCLAGPFLMQPKPGVSIGAWAAVPKLGGWIAGAAFFSLVGVLVGQRGWMEAAGFGLLLGVFGVLAARALRYVGFQRRFSRYRREIVGLIGGQVDPGEAGRLADEVMRRAAAPGASGDSGAGSFLRESGVGDPVAGRVADVVAGGCGEFLREPAEAGAPVGGREGAKVRAGCEFRRSLVLALFTFVWFLLVPVPGLLVFSAGGHRVLVGLWPFLGVVLAIVGGVLLCAAAGRALERLIVGGAGGRRGLRRRAQTLYREFRRRAAVPGRLGPGQVAAGFAAFSDFQTYLDQRAFRYAGRALDAVEAAAEGGSPDDRGGAVTARAAPDPAPPPGGAALPPSPAGG